MVFGNCSCQLLLLRNMVWLKIRLVSAQNHVFYLRSHFPFKILASNGITIKWCKMSWNCVHYELQYDHVLNHARALVVYSWAVLMICKLGFFFSGSDCFFIGFQTRTGVGTDRDYYCNLLVLAWFVSKKYCCSAVVPRKQTNTTIKQTMQLKLKLGNVTIHT